MKQRKDQTFKGNLMEVMHCLLQKLIRGVFIGNAGDKTDPLSSARMGHMAKNCLLDMKSMYDDKKMHRLSPK